MMLKRLFCSAEMCVMRRLSSCRSAPSGTSQQRGQPWPPAPLGTGWPKASSEGGWCLRGEEERGVHMELAAPAIPCWTQASLDGTWGGAGRCYCPALQWVPGKPGWAWASHCLKKGRCCYEERDSNSTHDKVTPGCHAGTSREGHLTVLPPPQDKPPHSADGDAPLQPPTTLYPKSHSFYSCSEMGTSGI